MTATPIKVEAIGRGFYNTRIRRPGDRFLVKSEKDLGSWMKRLDVPEPEPDPATEVATEVDSIGDPDLPPEPPGKPRGLIKPEADTLSSKLIEQPQTAGEFYAGKKGQRGGTKSDGL